MITALLAFEPSTVLPELRSELEGPKRMSLLVEGSAGTPVRRFVVTSVRGARLSPGLLLAVAGLPVLAAAGALLTTPVILSKAMTQDLLFNLAGAWHVHAGHVQHVDFHDPTGRLSFILTAIGFRLVGAIPFAILVNVAIVAAILFAASFVATVRPAPGTTAMKLLSSPPKSVRFTQSRFVVRQAPLMSGMGSPGLFKVSAGPSSVLINRFVSFQPAACSLACARCDERR
ncbi:MAG: hypothetical protein AB7S58_25300 [Dongiaceae bacterium]